MEINRGERGSFHRIGRALVRTSAAIGTGIKIKNILPGKILKLFNTKGFQIIQFFITDTISDRSDISSVKTHKKNIKQ